MIPSKSVLYVFVLLHIGLLFDSTILIPYRFKILRLLHVMLSDSVDQNDMLSLVEELTYKRNYQNIRIYYIEAIIAKW